MKNLFSYTLVKYCVTSAPSPLQPTNHPPEEQHTYSLTWWCGRYVGGWIILCLCFWLQWKLIPGGTKGRRILTLIYYKNTSHEELNPFLFWIYYHMLKILPQFIPIPKMWNFTN